LDTHGVDPHLDFSDMPAIAAEYEKVTRMHVYERTPYAGALVFAAFSGSHQDAIAKGMKWREANNLYEWTVPYLPLDPHDVGREYETDVIRINSQSGKGGIGYLLEQNYGYDLPAKMREALGYAVKSVSDHLHKELSPRDVYGIFESEFVNLKAPFAIPEAHYIQKDNQKDRIYAMATASEDGIPVEYTGKGNGRLD
ncbi:MAG: 2-isopropylmalate synthase, partial [Ruthenibacterium sp.]